MRTSKTALIDALRNEIETLKAENAKLSGNVKTVRTAKTAKTVGPADYLVCVGGKDFDLAVFLTQLPYPKRLPVAAPKNGARRVFLTAAGRIFAEATTEFEVKSGVTYLVIRSVSLLPKTVAYDGNYFAGLSTIKADTVMDITAGVDISVLVSVHCSDCGDEYKCSPDTMNLLARSERGGKEFHNHCPKCRAEAAAARAMELALAKAKALNATLKAKAA